MNDPVKFEAQKIKNFQKIEFKGKIDNENLIYLYGLSDNGEPGFNIIKEIDKINTFVKDYDNLSVILINTDKAGEIAKVKRFVKTKRYPLDNNYHIIMDYNQKLSRSFNAQPIPLTLITKNNQIIFRKRGFNVGDEIEIKNIIEQEIVE